MCKIHTNSKQASTIRERIKINVYSAQIACSLILNFDWSEKRTLVKILTKQQRCWRVVKSWSQGPNFDHFAQSEWLPLNKRRNTAK